MSVRVRVRRMPRKAFLNAMERWYWREIIKECGSITRAAKVAKTNRTEVYKRLHVLNLKGIIPGKRHRGKWDRPIPGDLRESPPQVIRTTRSTPPPVSPISALRAPTSTPAERRLARILALRPELLNVGKNPTLLTPDEPPRRSLS